jgi:hypothetical protein
MNKTIQQALIDEVHYPIPLGYIENQMIKRGLAGSAEATAEVLNSAAYVGCVADCLYSLIEAPNFNEADKSFSLPDRKAILSKVNKMYISIGEPEKALERPMVYIGG